MSRPVVVSLRAAGLGDLLTAVPALRAVRRAYPGHHHVLLGSASPAELARWSGAVDEVVAVEGLGRVPEGPRNAEVAVDLHGRGPQSHRLLLALAPRRLVAYAHPEVPASAGSPAWREDEHEVHRWVRLVRSAGMAADPSDLVLPPPRRHLPVDPRGATVVHPGAAAPSRRWPAGRFAAVAAAEGAAGRPVLVTGGPGESDLVAEVVARAGSPRPTPVLGLGTLDLLALVAGAGRVVCGDTGVAHLATAARTPSVVLFGPVPPSRWGPPPSWRHRALWKGRAGDPHGEVLDPGLAAIGVDEVLAELRRLDLAAA